MWLEIRRIEPQTIGVYPDNVGSIVLDEVHHALLENLVCHLLGEREDVLDGVALLLVEPTALHANSVHEQAGEFRRHFALCRFVPCIAAPPGGDTFRRR